MPADCFDSAPPPSHQAVTDLAHLDDFGPPGIATALCVVAICAALLILRGPSGAIGDALWIVGAVGAMAAIQPAMTWSRRKRGIPIPVSTDRVLQLEDAGIAGLLASFCLGAVFVALLIVFGSGGGLGTFFILGVSVNAFIGLTQAVTLARNPSLRRGADTS
jgi:hypothetical protein